MKKMIKILRKGIHGREIRKVKKDKYKINFSP